MLSYRELKSRLEKSSLPTLAILPVGCYEQHGPVLPLDTDTLIATSAAERLAEALKEHYTTHVFPCLGYTTTEPNRNYCGTVSVAASPFRRYLWEVCNGILESDFQALLILNSHGSIIGSLKETAFGLVHQQFRQKAEGVRPVLTLNVFDFDGLIAEELQQTPGRHADWKEFLLVYGILGTDYFTPARMEGLREFSNSHKFDDAMPKVIGIPAEFRTTDGVQGQPLPNGDDYAGLSRKVWELTTERLADTVKEALHEFTQLPQSRFVETDEI